MYLHLGKDISVEKKEIVMICDLDNCSYSYITREYLAWVQKAGQVINVSDDLPKAFVVCAPSQGGQRLYLSALSSATLLKRAETPNSVL